MIEGGTTPKIVAPTRWLPRAPTGNPAESIDRKPDQYFRMIGSGAIATGSGPNR